MVRIGGGPGQAIRNRAAGHGAISASMLTVVAVLAFSQGWLPKVKDWIGRQTGGPIDASASGGGGAPPSGPAPPTVGKLPGSPGLKLGACFFPNPGYDIFNQNEADCKKYHGWWVPGFPSP